MCGTHRLCMSAHERCCFASQWHQSNFEHVCVCVDPVDMFWSPGLVPSSQEDEFMVHASERPPTSPTNVPPTKRRRMCEKTRPTEKELEFHSPNNIGIEKKNPSLVEALAPAIGKIRFEMKMKTAKNGFSLLLPGRRQKRSIRDDQSFVGGHREGICHIHTHTYTHCSSNVAREGMSFPFP